MDEQTPTTQKSDNPDAVLPPTDIAEPLNPGTTEPATAQQLEQVEKQMSGFEKATLRWAKVAVGMSFLAAVFVCAQWYEMHSGGQDTHDLAIAAKDQAGKMKDMSDAADKIRKAAEDMVVQDQRIADNAQKALEASNKQSKASLDATVSQFRGDQRAWLGASDDTYTVAESGPIDNTVIVLNTGKSPAMKVLCRITGTTKPKGYVLRDIDIIYPPVLPTLKQGTLFPNQHFPLKAAGPPMEADKQKTWFENVQSGEWIQYFFGEVRYKDTFGKDHWTHFCTQFVPAAKNGMPCPIYNDTDDTKP